MSLIYEDKILANRPEFISEVKRYSKELGINPNWLMAVMEFESGLNPQAVNSVSGATGLIQFLPSTASGLGTSTWSLAMMGGVEQLYYVYKYLKPHKAKIKNYTDLYLAVFFPLAIGKPRDYVLMTSSQSAFTIANQNPIFDLDKNGVIEKKEIEKVMMDRIPANWKMSFSRVRWVYYLIMILAIIAFIWLVYKILT
jgi:hypothetical protein